MQKTDTMNIFKYFTIASLGLVILAGSCTKEYERSNCEGIPMRIVPSIAGETKGSMSTDSLREFQLQVKSADHFFSYFETVSKTGTTWAAQRQIYWKNETDPITFSAASFGYHTFTAKEFEEGASLLLPNNQRNQYWINTADLLVVTPTVIKCEDTSEGVLPLAFSHALAKINFVISLGEKFYQNGYTDAKNPISCMLVKGTDMRFTFTPSNGEVKAVTGTAEDIKPFPSAFIPGTASDQTAKATYEVILVPQTLAAGQLKISFTVCEVPYEWSNSEEITLEPGKTCNLPINITEAPAPSQHIYGHRYVELGDGIKWATCNIGSPTAAGFGEQYWWGATETFLFTPWRRGGTEGGYAAMGALINTNYNQEGETLRPEDDPATAQWGAPWRLATKEEWEKLYDTEKFTWSTVSNYKGTGTSGQIITSKVPGYEGNYIFLPHTGKVTCFIGTASGGLWYLTATFYSSSKTLFADLNRTGHFMREVDGFTRPVAD